MQMKEAGRSKSAGEKNCEKDGRKSRRRDTEMLKEKKKKAWKNSGFGVANIEIQDSTSNQRTHSRASKNAMLMK